MEKSDELLIEKYIGRDEELRAYMEAHSEYEKALEALNKKVYLTPEEEIEKKILQKKKLRGKEKIFQLLLKYRTAPGIE
ncbi:MAG: DUF465 domain-containing protein [Deltaproteobacteria bacterium]|nr:DUF465 domain-containing protein [Deltaproteobacteria bacterium]